MPACSQAVSGRFSWLGRVHYDIEGDIEDNEDNEDNEVNTNDKRTLGSPGDFEWPKSRDGPKQETHDGARTEIRR